MQFEPLNMSKDSELRSLEKVTDYVEDKQNDNNNINNVRNSFRNDIFDQNKFFLGFKGF